MRFLDILMSVVESGLYIVLLSYPTIQAFYYIFYYFNYLLKFNNNRMYNIKSILNLIEKGNGMANLDIE